MIRIQMLTRQRDDGKYICGVRLPGEESVHELEGEFDTEAEAKEACDQCAQAMIEARGGRIQEEPPDTLVVAPTVPARSRYN